MSDNPRDSRSSDDGRSRSLSGLTLRRSSYNPAPRQRDSSYHSAHRPHGYTPESQWQSFRSNLSGIYAEVDDDGGWDFPSGNSVDSPSAYSRERTPSPIHPRGTPLPPAASFSRHSDRGNRSRSWERLPGKSPQRRAWPEERNMPVASGSRAERPRDRGHESSHPHAGDSRRPGLPRDIIDGTYPSDIPRGAYSGSYGPWRSSTSFSDRADDMSSPPSSVGSAHHPSAASSHSRASSPHRPYSVASVDAYNGRTSPPRMSSIASDSSGRRLSVSMDPVGPRPRETPKSYERPPGLLPHSTSYALPHPGPRLRTPPVNTPNASRGSLNLSDETDEFGRVLRKDSRISHPSPAPESPHRAPTRPRSPTRGSGGSYGATSPTSPGFRNLSGPSPRSPSASIHSAHSAQTHVVPNGTSPTARFLPDDSRRPDNPESPEASSIIIYNPSPPPYTYIEDLPRAPSEIVHDEKPPGATTTPKSSAPAAPQDTKSSPLKPMSPAERLTTPSGRYSPSTPVADARGAPAPQALQSEAQQSETLPITSSNDWGTEMPRIFPEMEPLIQFIAFTDTLEQLRKANAFGNGSDDLYPPTMYGINGRIPIISPTRETDLRDARDAITKSEVDPDGEYKDALQWNQNLQQPPKESPQLSNATPSERASQSKLPDEELLPSVTSPEARPAAGFSDTLHEIREAASSGENDIIDAILSENYHLTHSNDGTISSHADAHTGDVVVNGIPNPQTMGETPVEDLRNANSPKSNDMRRSHLVESPHVPGTPSRLPADERFLLPPPTDGETRTFTDALRKATYQLGPITPVVDSILTWNGGLNSNGENRSAISPETVTVEVDSDEIYEEDRKIFRSIQPKLSAQFSRDGIELERKNQALRDEYRTFLDSWDLHRQRLDRLEAVRNRKQNLLGGEDGNSRNRRGAISLGDAARSDLELDQIMASLVNEDLTNPDILARRNVAVIPDMLSVTDPRALECQYDDLNGLVTDPVAYADSVRQAGEWTPTEMEIFIRAYIATPKQFGRIAEQLPHKSPEQCVLFYYLKKKEINFKGLLSKQGGGRGRRRGRRGGKQKGNALLNDLRQPRGDDEDLSVNDSSPAPGTPASDSDAGPSRPRLSLRESGRSAAKRRASRAASYDPDSGSDEDEQRSPSSNDRDKNGGDYEDNETRESSDAPQKSRKRVRVEDSSTPKDIISRPKPRGGKGPSGKGSTTHWTLADKAIFMRLLPIHGKNWAVIAEDLPDKTPVQVRNYFQNHSVELGLPAIAARAEKPPRGAGNPNKVVKAETPRNENVSLVRLGMLLQSLGGLDFKPGQPASLPQGYKPEPSLESSSRTTIKSIPGHGSSLPSQSLPAEPPAPVPPPSGGVQIRFGAHDLNQRTAPNASQEQRAMLTGNIQQPPVNDSPPQPAPHPDIVPP